MALILRQTKGRISEVLPGDDDTLSVYNINTRGIEKNTQMSAITFHKNADFIILYIIFV